MISKCMLIEPFFCNENDAIADVAKKLKQFGQRHIYVVDSAQKPLGIISITDILDKVVIAGLNAAQTKAKDVMNKDILIFNDEEDVRKAYKAMSERGVVTCAITQKDKMVGMLSLKEALKCVTDPKMIQV